MPNTTCIKCGKMAYELNDEIICLKCNKPEKQCTCCTIHYELNNNRETIKTIKRHLKGIEIAVKKLEKE
jgi:hypothetical protein